MEKIIIISLIMSYGAVAYLGIRFAINYRRKLVGKVQ